MLRGHVDSTALLRLSSLNVRLQHCEDSDIAMGVAGGEGGGGGVRCRYEIWKDWLTGRSAVGAKESSLTEL